MTWWKIAIGKSGHTSTTAYPLIGVLEVTGGQSQRNPILPQGRLGNETRSSIACFGEVPNCRQRNHRSKKADCCGLFMLKQCTAFPFTNCLFPTSFANWEARSRSSFFVA
jgi:hypothetical protein